MPTQKLTDRVVNRKPPATGYVELFDAITPGLALRINAGGRRSYFVMTRVKGRMVDGKLKELIKHSLGTTDQIKTVAKAREKAREVLSDAAIGISPKAAQEQVKREVERAQKNTFRAVAEEFMETHAVHLRSKDDYQAQLDRAILPKWGALPIRDITRADVKELIRDKAKKHPIAANRILALIRKIFNWALDEDLIDASPAARIKPPGKEVERDRYHDDDEIRLLWPAFERLGTPYGPLFKILLLTGQRKNEVAEMKWSEVKDDAWLLSSERVKGGKGHLVPLSPLALEIIKGIPQIDDYEHVFTTGLRGDRPPSGWSVIKKRLDKFIAQAAADEAGEELDLKKHSLEPWWVHDLRATFATGLINLHIDKTVVSKCLNHAEAGVTKRYLRGSDDPEKRHALETWARHIEVLAGGEPTDNVYEIGRKP